MFEIEMLPAREGDCLWLRYGTNGNTRQILVDGGRAATAKHLKARLAALPAGKRTFELLIITHIDRDHIEGVLALLEDKKLPVTFKDVWFNGFDHLHQAELETFGAIQGERLSKALVERKLPWNRAWKMKAVCLHTSGLRRVKLVGGLTLTLLSPDAGKLKSLIPVWKEECKKAGLLAGSGGKPSDVAGLEHFGALDIEKLAAAKFKEDPGEPNGSSIAVLAEYAGKRVLLTGDAHTDRLKESLRLLNGKARRLRLDALKVSHHGSEHNVSRDLLDLLACPRYLVSTNGSYFKHPTPAAIARLIKFGGQGATIHFNYRSAYTEVWNNQAWQAKYGYRTEYPDKKNNGTLVVAL